MGSPRCPAPCCGPNPALLVPYPGWHSTAPQASRGNLLPNLLTGPPPLLTRPPTHSPDVLTEEAVKFLGGYEQDDRPFFLYLAPCGWPLGFLSLNGELPCTGS